MTARSPAALAAWPTTAMAWPVPRTVGSTVVRRSGGMPSLADSSPVLGSSVILPLGTRTTSSVSTVE
eukprot:scaffold74725_cov33-Phaeocystis_antarctica.AAC.1